MEEAFPQATLRALPDGSLSVTGDYDAAAVSRLLHDADQTVLELNPVRRDIEDYFVELMEGRARGRGRRFGRGRRDRKSTRLNSSHRL